MKSAQDKSKGSQKNLAFLANFSSASSSDKLIEISAETIDVAKSLLALAQKLHDGGKTKEANTLLDLVGRVLDNNENLQKVVREIKAKAE
jgi:hypothetical protein